MSERERILRLVAAIIGTAAAVADERGPLDEQDAAELARNLPPDVLDLLERIVEAAR